MANKYNNKNKSIKDITANDYDFNSAFDVEDFKLFLKSFSNDNKLDSNIRRKITAMKKFYTQQTECFENECKMFCPVCESAFDSRSAYEMSHNEADSKGAKANWSNLVLTCIDCNNFQGNKTFAEYIQDETRLETVYYFMTLECTKANEAKAEFEVLKENFESKKARFKANEKRKTPFSWQAIRASQNATV